MASFSLTDTKYRLVRLVGNTISRCCGIYEVSSGIERYPTNFEELTQVVKDRDDAFKSAVETLLTELNASVLKKANRRIPDHIGTTMFVITDYINDLVDRPDSYIYAKLQRARSAGNEQDRNERLAHIAADLFRSCNFADYLMRNPQYGTIQMSKSLRTNMNYVSASTFDKTAATSSRFVPKTSAPLHILASWMWEPCFDFLESDSAKPKSFGSIKEARDYVDAVVKAEAKKAKEPINWNVTFNNAGNVVAV